MQILLFRHAERANTGGDNPSLSPRGQGQARALLQMIENKKLETPQRMICSPKLRAQKTFEGVAKNLSLDLQTWEDLDERQSNENNALFSARVRRCLDALSTQSGCIFVCTHVDWIEEALIFIPSDSDLNQTRYMSWAPGQFMEFEVQNEVWHLTKQGVLPEC